MTKNIEATLSASSEQRQRITGGIMCLAGSLGMFFFTYQTPESYDSVSATVWWASGTMISSIVAFAGFPGMFPRMHRSDFLKIVDLIWVLGSAVAIVFAVVQASQYFADETRSSMSKNIEKARNAAKDASAIAYQQQCVQPSRLTAKQCESLRVIAISLSVGGYVPSSEVESLCHFPINLDNPPAAFGGALVSTCTSLGYVTSAPEDPIMKDKANAEAWQSNVRSWPIFMILLVSLRIMKSVTEVFWKRD